MLKRKTFIKKAKSVDNSSSRNLRLRRLHHQKKKLFIRHAMQFVVQDICC